MRVFEFMNRFDFEQVMPEAFILSSALVMPSGGVMELKNYIFLSAVDLRKFTTKEM